MTQSATTLREIIECARFSPPRTRSFNLWCKERGSAHKVCVELGAEPPKNARCSQDRKTENFPLVLGSAGFLLGNCPAFARSTNPCVDFLSSPVPARTHEFPPAVHSRVHGSHRARARIVRLQHAEIGRAHV